MYLHFLEFYIVKAIRTRPHEWSASPRPVRVVIHGAGPNRCPDRIGGFVDSGIGGCSDISYETDVFFKLSSPFDISERSVEAKRGTMSEQYGRVVGGRLTFKGGQLAARKSIEKKKKKKKNKDKQVSEEEIVDAVPVEEEETQNEDIYTIDASKRMKYDDLFPVEAKKFGYDPKSKSRSVEDALDDRVKKKADRYCK
ncbi:hypothetical protein H6P81_018286 [Aristolochia fimbriata]|uniref:Uncharacterized protein n=1 Tax=Aristolochia fimbriata TaxID=158543 RepID=A0AAV7E0Y8_ARIFI|nr:hypothetical protein H6P81_018286 [Aristolochia fimbriata]